MKQDLTGRRGGGAAAGETGLLSGQVVERPGWTWVTVATCPSTSEVAKGARRAR